MPIKIMTEMINMKILLLRHGWAEDKDPSKNDYYRKLTPKGIKQLKKYFPDLALYLDGKKIKLLTSPMTRTVQTADELRVLIPGLKAEVREYIASGDIEGLKEDYFKYKKDYDYMIVTGHAPHLDLWTKKITDRIDDMAKGSSTEIEIVVDEDFKGRVNWHLKAQKYSTLTQFQRFLKSQGAFYNDIKEKVEEIIAVILKMRENYLEKPEEIESVHKLRVKVRQFRSFVSFLKPLLPKKSYTLMQNDLRELAQECAYLRELDVLMKEWKTHSDRFEKAGVSGDEFFTIMTNERKKEQERLYSYLEKPNAAMMLNEAKNIILKNIHPEVLKYVTLKQMLIETLNSWHDRIQHDYENIDSNNLVIIHALRIKAKKMRYVMEVFGLDKDEATKEMYQEVKKWQEVIGEITDANRNSDAVNEIEEKSDEKSPALHKEVEVFNEIQKENADNLYMEFFGKPSHEIDLFSDIRNQKDPEVKEGEKEIEKTTPSEVKSDNNQEEQETPEN